LNTERIKEEVKSALAEDIGEGDLTARLLAAETMAMADLLCRSSGVLCGTAWFEEVFHQLDPGISVTWNFKDGDILPENCRVCSLTGHARAMLTGERTALNFLQTLSGTATRTRQYVDVVKATAVKILDTRKTLPGLRISQKYAVRCGGGVNHRIGLYDAILIKENHIRAAGSIETALARAKTIATEGQIIEIEVENLDELGQAVMAGASRILIDNFSIDDIKLAVNIAGGRSELEASGGINLQNIKEIAETGVTYISVGDITKNLRAVDYSLIITDTSQ